MSGENMQGKRVLITGGNSGIGMHTAIGLAKLGAEVIFTARNPDKGTRALQEIRRAANVGDAVQVMALDLASFASIRGFAKSFCDRFDRLDVLVNNAGLLIDRRETTEEGFETTFGVNHLGHFLLTDLLLPLLKQSAPARIVHVASDAHKGARKGLDFDDLQRERGYSAFGVYAQSKLANILFSNELARRLDSSRVTSNALHPGVIRSGFAMDGDVGGFGSFVMALARPFMSTPTKGAATSVYLASAPDMVGKSGGYYARSKLARSTRFAKDEAAAKQLWELSETLIKQGRPS